MAGHPVGQLRIAQAGEGGERALAHVAVALDVVAAQDAEGGHASLATTGERLGHQPENGVRCGSRTQVGQDRRVGGNEFTGDRVEVVAAFGDSERHDPGGRRGHLLDGRLGIVGGEQVLGDRPDHAGIPGAVAVPDDQGVQAILGGHHVTHPGVGRLQAQAADPPVHRRAVIHQRVDVHRLVRAVEIADTDVNDAGRDLAAIVTRAGGGVVQLRQGLLVQRGHAVLTSASEGWVASRAETLRAATTRRNLAWRSA